MMQNKRGIVPALVIPIAIAFLMVIAGIAFLASPTIRFQLIGIAIGIGTFVYILPAILSGEVTRPKVAILLILLGTGAFFIFGAGLLQQTALGGAQYIEAPIFATIECKQSGTSKTVEAAIPASGGIWISDNLPKNTNEWSVILKSQDAGLISFGRHFEYYVCTRRDFSTCNIHQRQNVPRSGGTLSIGTFPSDHHIWVEFQYSGVYGYTAVEGGSYSVTYKPFNLVRKDVTRGGEQQLSDAVGCTLPTNDPAWLGRVLSSDNPLLKTSTGDNTLVPGETFNYVTGTITRAALGNIQDGGYCIYQNGKANVYDIDTLRTAQSSYNVVNVDKLLKTAQCCNNQATPTQVCQNGAWVSTEKAECTTSAQCGSLEFTRDLSDPTQAMKFTCVESKCVKQTKKVECTLDSQCRTNQRCSSLSFTCIDASAQGPGVPRDAPKTSEQQNCEDKAKKNPFLGYSYVTTTVDPTIVEEIFTLGFAKPKTTGECKATFVPYYVWGSLGVVLIVTIFFLLKPVKKRR